MSSVSDSENEALSRSVDVVGSPSTMTPSTSTSSSGSITPTSRGQGAARLEEILQVGPSTRPDSQFVRELGGAAAEQEARVTSTDEATPERSAGEASTSGRDDEESSDSTDPTGEQLEDRNRPASHAMRINDQRVHRRSDQLMMELAGGFPVYSADFFTSAVTPRYLATLRREFQIPADVDLRVPGQNDLPSRPPPGYVTLYAEYFRAGLRLPFHQFLRRALTYLNVAPIQLNANAFRILIRCFILWSKNYAAGLPIRAFQNLYRMKTAPASTGSYYFQAFKGTFVTKCPDSDKQFRHLWFYAGGRWLHGHLARNELPRAERVPVVFRRGYAWTRAPFIPERTQDMLEGLQNLPEHERDQRSLLSQASLTEYGWLGSSSSAPRPDSRVPDRVTVAMVPEPVHHYRSRTIVVEDEASPDLSRDPSPRSWGPRIADEDLDLVIKGLSPARGQPSARALRIEEPMADRRGTKRPNEDERRERLTKMAMLGKGKGKAGPSAPPIRAVAPPAPPVTRVVPPPAPAAVPVAPPPPQTGRPISREREDRPVRQDVRASRPREERPTVASTARGNREEQRAGPAPAPGQVAESSAHRALVKKFGEQLSDKVAESSKRSDPVHAIEDCAGKLVEALCLAFSGAAAAKGSANRAADDIKAAEANTRHARRAEKEAKAAKDAADEARKAAEDKAKAAEERAERAEEGRRQAEEWAHKAERDADEAESTKLELSQALASAERGLASARAEHERYLQVALPAALEEARAQAVADFLESEDYNDRIVHMYQEGMRDMKAGFTAANPSLVGVDWSFVPAESEEMADEEAAEEGEVTGAARVPEEVVALDDQVIIPEQLPGPEQTASSVPEPAVPVEPEQQASQPPE